MSAITESAVREALARVEDPEIGKPITDLGMVKSITIDGADVNVEVYLTISGCPMKSTIQSNTQAAVAEVDGVENVSVSLDVMSDEQRRSYVTPCVDRSANQKSRFPSQKAPREFSPSLRVKAASANRQ